MNTKDLLKEAIADAKTVRETALAQAKLALEEAFTPRLQSMFAAKLQEEMDEELDEAKEEMDEAKVEMDEVEVDEAKEKMDETADMESYDDDDNSIDEIDLDEILAELDAELSEAKAEDDKDELKEAKDEESEEEEVEAEEDVEDEEDDAKEDEDEEKEVSDLSMDELEELIRDIVSQEVEGDGGEEVGDEEATMDAEMDLTADKTLPDTTDDEVNLDEILAELLGEEKEEVDEVKKDEDKEKMDEELRLALEAVDTLRQELQEVNLLNAKLLYVNKIFKAKNLTESQKLTVVKAFDKAESAKEAKLVYESLNETFTTKAAKSQIKESLGFASKAAGVAPQKSIIVESNDFVARMKKLANIK